MAYNLHHTVKFFNCLNEQLHIELYKKDVVPEDVTELLATSFSVNYPVGNGDKFDTLITCEAKLTLYLQAPDPVTFDDFIVTFADEWKLIAYNDEQIVFVGFLTPGEGRAEFQDKPYDISLSAVDGLGLLKGVPLTKIDGSKFTGVNLIIDYIIAILDKTGLDLNLRLFSSIVEESMEDRNTNPQADTFNQSGLHIRTFLKNPIELYDCYTCLERILTQYFAIYQHYGMWVIVRIGELQESVGAKIWYTEYDSTGAIVDAQRFLYDPGATGRDRKIHPVEVSQFIGSTFAVKSARYTFNYSTWPEIPTNNKFDRGTMYEEGPLPGTDGQTYKKFTIDNWLYGVTNPTNNATQPPNGMLATNDSAYRYTVYSRFGVEEDREIVLERDHDAQVGHRFLRSEPIPVTVGSRVNISFDFKTSQNGTGTRQYFLVMLETLDGSNGYRLDNAGGATPPDGIGTLIWAHTSALRFLAKYYDNGEDAAQYYSFNLNPPPLPITGNLYIIFMSYDAPMGRKVFYKNFSFEYYPSVAGFFAQVKGDYAQTAQNDRYKDVIDEEVFMSDTTHKVLQGAIYRENLTDLTTPTWRRLGITETRHFKEIGELARFNANYRRMWKIDGQYDGLKFSPAGNSAIIEPLSFHRQYAFPDSALLNGHYFVLVPPLNINYSEGRADMNFVEVLQAGSGDGNDFGDNHIPIEYIFQ